MGRGEPLPWTLPPRVQLSADSGTPGPTSGQCSSDPHPLQVLRVGVGMLSTRPGRVADPVRRAGRVPASRLAAWSLSTVGRRRDDRLPPGGSSVDRHRGCTSRAGGLTGGPPPGSQSGGGPHRHYGGGRVLHRGGTPRFPHPGGETTAPHIRQGGEARSRVLRGEALPPPGGTGGEPRRDCCAGPKGEPPAQGLAATNRKTLATLTKRGRPRLGGRAEVGDPTRPPTTKGGPHRPERPRGWRGTEAEGEVGGTPPDRGRPPSAG